VNGLEFSDYYCNEWGVAVASDACPSREDRRDLSDGGIGFDLRRIVAERSRTAAEGVRIAGSLLDRFGYASSGRTYVICDPDEGWILSAVAGRHWVAERVPDDAVVVLPNSYIVREVDGKDGARFVISADDPVEYARARGWWSPEAGAFDFASAYAAFRPGVSLDRPDGRDLRQWRGQSLLCGDRAPDRDADDPAFAVKPRRKIGPGDLMAVLRDRMEGTPWAAAPCDTCNPHRGLNRTICHHATVLSVVAELRPDVPIPLRGRLWVAFGRPDAAPFTPWYASIDDVPAGFHNTPGIQSPDSALARHFTPVAGTFDRDTAAAFWIFKGLADLVDERYAERIRPVAGAWNALEKSLFASQDGFEKTALESFRNRPDGLRRVLTERTRSLAESAVETARALGRVRPRAGNPSNASPKAPSCSSTESTSG
jgi:dipeptidase